MITLDIKHIGEVNELLYDVLRRYPLQVAGAFEIVEAGIHFISDYNPRWTITIKLKDQETKVEFKSYTFVERKSLNEISFSCEIMRAINAAHKTVLELKAKELEKWNERQSKRQQKTL